MTRRKTPRRMMAFGFVAALVLSAPAPALAEPLAAFTYSGRCEQVGAFVPADAGAVREYVPADWPLYEVAGKAILLVTAGSCRDSIAGGPEGIENRFGLVAAASGPPDPRLGAGEGYDIWWTHSDRAHHRMFRRAGFFSRRVRETRVEVSEGLVTVTGEAQVPWRRSPFNVRVTGAPVWTPPTDLTSYHWHARRTGLSLLKSAHSDFTVAGGSGEVTAAPGTPLARLLGGTRAAGAGAIFRFDFSAAIGPFGG